MRGAAPASQSIQLQASGIVPDTKRTLYVVSRNSAAILGFPAGATGNVKPSVIVSGSATMLGDPDAFAIAPDGQLYVANDGASTVLIFAKGAHGNAAPKVLGGSKAPIGGTEGVAVDRSGEIYVSDYENSVIYVFKSGSVGNVVPARVISGAKTKLAAPCGMAFDSAGHLYVGNKGSTIDPILEFDKDANGNVAPMHTLGGSNSGITGVFNPAIAPNDDIIAINEGSGTIDVFAAGAHGNATPIRVISGSKTLLSDVLTIGVDSTGKIHATNLTSSPPESLLVFSATANGNVAPIADISGSKTKFDEILYPIVY